MMWLWILKASAVVIRTGKDKYCLQNQKEVRTTMTDYYVRRYTNDFITSPPCPLTRVIRA